MKADSGKGGDGAFLKVLTPEFLSKLEGGMCGVGRREGVRECWLGWLAGWLVAPPDTEERVFPRPDL